MNTKATQAVVEGFSLRAFVSLRVGFIYEYMIGKYVLGCIIRTLKAFFSQKRRCNDNFLTFRVWDIQLHWHFSEKRDIQLHWVPCLCTLIYHGVYYVNIEVVHITIALFKGLPKNAVQAVFPVTRSKKKTFHWTERRNTLHSSNELSFCFLLANTPVLL